VSYLELGYGLASFPNLHKNTNGYISYFQSLIYKILKLVARKHSAENTIHKKKYINQDMLSIASLSISQPSALY